MVKQGFKRKLTTILSADVEGYSRLMGEDESATVKTLETYKEVMFTLIKQHRGRVIDSPGDNVLAEFGSVVDAVQCGVSVQKEFQARNAGLPKNRRMEFRVGINLGDVIEEEGRIYGDGVNIAARLESLAEPGGICVSKTAFDHIESKLPLGYQYLGEQTVKNIAKPVGAYRVVMEPRIILEKEKKAAETIPFWRRKPAIAGAIAVLVLIIGVAVWNFHFRFPPIEPASVEKMAYPLPEKPSVAVLPFVNMSDDPKQEFFSDGLTDQIIASLSKVHELFVIARNSTFSYKGKPVKVQQVAEDLGVRYVLEGSVRKSEDKLRVTVQLIDALKGHHLWAEQYDREMKDLFAVQDDITMQILVALQVQLTYGPVGKAKGTRNLQAYLKFLEALSVFFQFTRDGNVRSRQLFEETIAIDPEYANAYALLSFIHQLDMAYGLSKSRRDSVEKATWYAKKAQSLDEKNYVGRMAMAGAYLVERDFENAVKEARKAIDLAPGAAGPYSSLARALCFSGRSHEAIDYFKKAIRIDPFPSPGYYHELGYAYFLTGNYEEAIRVSKKACALMPDNEDCHRMLAASYGMLGKDTEARAEAAELLRIVPDWSIEGWKQRQAAGWKNQADVDQFAEGSRRAGLPEKPPLSLPDKPSIAVLPFVNMSGDPEQEYFSDGITEEIITALSKIEQMFVIARNSTFNYKGKHFTIQQVGEELGVRYVLEGSVRMSGDRVRVTAQLVDAITGSHLWAERYDREVKDIFVVQDDITKQIITALQVKLTKGEQARMSARGTNNLEAYLKCLQGWERGGHNMHVVLLARKLYEEAIALDPNYATAYAYLGYNIWSEQFYGSSEAPEVLNEKAFELAQKALSLDDALPIAHRLLGAIYLSRLEHDKAIAEAELAIALDPNGADAYATLGRFLYTVGEYEKSIAMFKEAMRLNPFPPHWYFSNLAWGYILAERYEEAIEACKKAIALQPRDFWAHLHLAAAYSLSGRDDLAQSEAAEALKINPKFSVENRSKEPGGYFRKQADIERYYEGLRKAGLK